MGTWIIKKNGDPDDEPLITITSYSNDGTVSLHMPSQDPVVVTTRKVEEIRWAAGAAIADAQSDPSSASQVDV